MNKLWVGFALLSFVGCESIWDGYEKTNPDNCVKIREQNGGMDPCAQGQRCNPVTEICQDYDVNSNAFVCNDAQDCPLPNQPTCDTDLHLCAPCTQLKKPLADVQCQSKNRAGANICISAPLKIDGADNSMLGQCGECVSSADCNLQSDVGLACVNNHCSACRNSDDCASQVCDLYSSPSGLSQLGRCIDPSIVWYVNNAPTTDCIKADGSLQRPFCNWADLKAKLTSNVQYIKFIPSDTSYGKIDLNGVNKTISMVGVSVNGMNVVKFKSMVFNTNPTSEFQVNVSGIVFDGENDSSQAVYCDQINANFPKIALKQNRFHQYSANSVIRINGCSIDMDGNIFTNSYLSSLSNPSIVFIDNNVMGSKNSQQFYRVVNNLVYSNSYGNATESQIFYFGNDVSDGQFGFNTVFSNKPMGSNPRIIRCNTKGQPKIYSSILQQEAPIADGNNPNCQFISTLVGQSSTISDTTTGAIKQDPVFINTTSQKEDFHLKPGSPGKNAAENYRTQPVEYDLQGVRRASGNIKPDVGAFESLPKN